jgi:hypothetical protein
MGESAVERYLLISPYRLSTIRPGASTVSSWPDPGRRRTALIALQRSFALLESSHSLAKNLQHRDAFQRHAGGEQRVSLQHYALRPVRFRHPDITGQIIGQPRLKTCGSMIRTRVITTRQSAANP